MKGGVRKKGYSIFILSNFVSLPLLGWYFGGAIFLIIGLCLAIAIDIFFPTWKYELTWRDIELALKNIYKYGSNPCELCIRVGERRIFVYRDEKDTTRRGGPPSKRTRMAICMPVADWSDLLTDDDYDKLFKLHGGKAMFSNNRGPESYDIFTRIGRELEDCKDLLEALFEKSIGGLRPDIYARSVVNAKKNIWINHSEQEMKKAGKRKSNANP
jgi:hypothetical protein